MNVKRYRSIGRGRRRGSQSGQSGRGEGGGGAEEGTGVEGKGGRAEEKPVRTASEWTRVSMVKMAEVEEEDE